MNKLFSLNLAFALSLAASSAQTTGTNDPIRRIRDEGLNHSKVMDTLSYLTDIIGPRLTGSPNLKRANEWTRSTLTEWGLTNANLEAWGPFGRGWSLKRFSAQVIEPQTIPLIGCPNAWSPGFDKPRVAEVIYFDARTNADLEKLKGKLKGEIVLSGQPREIKPMFEPMALRLVETNLLQLANAGDRSTAGQSGDVFRGGFGGGTGRVARAEGGFRRGGAGAEDGADRKSTRLNSSLIPLSRIPY